jgi:very-short-patch-repair endonuclease
MKKNYKYLPYDVRLTEKARENRRNPTSAENKMWYEILGNKEFEGLKFTRQKPIDRFIVDFFCSELMLAVEIDGDSHDEQRKYDEQRTRILNGLGITVIRYMNNDVLHNMNGVYLDLKKKVERLRKTKSVEYST